MASGKIGSDNGGETSASLGPAGAALIKQYESCGRKRADGRFEAYPDPGTGGDPWTIGWGSTGNDIAPGTIWTQAECDARFDEDAARFVAGVVKLLGQAPTGQHQRDALTSFAYNLGLGNLNASTLLRKHLAGDHAGAQAEFGKWNKAAGRVLAGLTRRRTAEAALYGMPDYTKLR